MGSKLAQRYNQDHPAQLVPQAPAPPARQDGAVLAAAEAAKATVQAQFLVAQGRPRDMQAFRLRMLDAARRPGFAGVAIYERPVGGGKMAKGPSIRFAEEAHRNFGNLATNRSTIYDGPESRTIRVQAIDFETNASHSIDVEVSKTVERKRLRDGQTPIGQRVNASGQTVYLVEASEVDLRTKAAAEAAKARRECILALMPGDIVEEAMRVAEETRHKGDQEDPEAAQKALLSAYHSLGVSPAAIKQYVGKPLAQVRPDEWGELRSLWAAIRDGETTWAEAVAAKLEPPEEAPAEPGGLDELADELNRKAPPAAPEKPKRRRGPNTPKKEQLIEMAREKLGASGAEGFFDGVFGEAWQDDQDWSLTARREILAALQEEAEVDGEG